MYKRVNSKHAIHKLIDAIHKLIDLGNLLRVDFIFDIRVSYEKLCLDDCIQEK